MASQFDDARQLLREVRKDFMKKANVVATGVGYKVVNGKVSKDISIVCSVSSKKPGTKLSSADLVPKNVEGIPTDVFTSGAINALDDPKKRYRPAPGGVSIGHYLITAGTLGCVVSQNGKKLILSNNHVLANSNDADKGDEILQPGPTDGGTRPSDIIGKLYDFVPIVFEGGGGGGGGSDCPFANGAASFLNAMSAAAGRKSRLKAVYDSQEGENLVDAALAEPNSQDDIKAEILNIGSIKGVSEATLGMSLKKSGRTTEFTTGTVLQVDVTSTVNYGGGKQATFVDQIMAGAMSAGGDSGSAVLNSDDNIVGLLFAGSSSTTIINRIQNVFDLLNVTLL